jgi:Holliday junction resolvase RusA-like endonuclease
MVNLRIHQVDSMMVDATLYLRLYGEPTAQPRPHARRNIHGRIIIYDPRIRFRGAGQVLINAALADIGLRDRPVFTTGWSIRVTCHYFVGDMRKDIDNLLKFTMDLLVGPTILADDRFVCEVCGVKSQEPDDGDFRMDVEVEYLD